MSKRNSGFKTNLLLAAAKPLSPNELSQSYTPAIDNNAIKEPSVTPPPTSKSDHIKVICRFRPKNSKERAEEKRQNLSSSQAIEVYNEGKSLEIPRKTKNKPKLNFTLDSIIWCDATQEQTFVKLAADTVNSVIEGYNCTIFAFGQTGSGKTYTMFGNENLNKIEELGIIPRSVNYMFKLLNQSKNILKYQISLSICEVYKEMLRDLLTSEKSKNRKRLEILSAGKEIRVKNLTEKQCDSVGEILKYIVMAQGNRAKQTTDFIGHDSSRSHCVVMISITQRLLDDTIKSSKLSFGDLAGSELAAKTHASGSNLKEAGKIHQGLLALENVINALVEKRKHVPYNDSKLTRLLATSIGGNSKTTLLVTCSPSIWNRDETISTLRFAKRAKKIKNKAKINRRKTREQLEARIIYLEQECLKLKKKLNKQKFGGKFHSAVDFLSTDEAKNRVFGISADEKEETDQLLMTKDNEINGYLDEIIKLKDLINKKDDQLTQIEGDLNNKNEVVYEFDREKKEYIQTINELNNKLSRNESQIDKLQNKLNENIELQTKFTHHTENLSSIVNDSVKDSSTAMVSAFTEITKQQQEFYNFLKGMSNNIEKIHEKQMSVERDVNDRFDDINQLLLGIGINNNNYSAGLGYNDNYEPELSMISNSEYDVPSGHHAQQSSFNFDEDDFDFGNRKLSVASLVLSPEQLQLDQDNKTQNKKGNQTKDDRVVLTDLISSMRSYLDKVKDENNNNNNKKKEESKDDNYLLFDKNTFSIGKKVDVLDVSYNWYSASIADIDVFDKKAVYIKYDNFEARWNEWISLNKSYRIAPHKSRICVLTNNPSLKSQHGGVHCLVATKYARSKNAYDLQQAFSENNSHSNGHGHGHSGKKKISKKTILIQGHLYKQSNWSKKNWKRRWFVIRNNHNIYYYDNKNMKAKNYRGIISLGAISAVQISKKDDGYTKFSFSITTSKNKKHFFSCNNESDLIDWISSIECLVFSDCHQINIKNESQLKLSKPVYDDNDDDEEDQKYDDDNGSNHKAKKPISPRIRQSFSGFADKIKKFSTKQSHHGPYTASIEQID